MEKISMKRCITRNPCDFIVEILRKRELEISRKIGSTQEAGK